MLSSLVELYEIHAGDLSLIPSFSPKPTWNRDPGGPGAAVTWWCLQENQAGRRGWTREAAAMAASGFQRWIYHQVSGEGVRNGAVITQHEP